MHGVEIVNDFRVQHYFSDNIGIKYKILPKKEKYSEKIEFSAKMLDLSKSIYSLDVIIYCDSIDNFELILYADGLRYHCYYRDAWGSTPKQDCEFIIEK